MARASEAAARHDKKVLLFRAFCECHIVVFQCTRKHVKRSVWFGYVIAHVPQAFYKQVFVCFIDRNIRCFIHAGCAYTLEQARRADIAKRTPGTRSSGINQLKIIHRRGYEQIAHPFAWQ